MILLSLLSIFEALFKVTLGALPTSPTLGLNTQMTSLVSSGPFSYIGWANNYLPVSEVLTALGILLTVWLAMFGFRLLMWVLEKLHVVGGSE